MRSFLSFRIGLGTCLTLNVGDKLRRNEKPAVALYLMCDVDFDATTRQSNCTMRINPTWIRGFHLLMPHLEGRGGLLRVHF